MKNTTEIYSSCCGVEPRGVCLDLGICPDCHDHCDFVESDDADGAYDCSTLERLNESLKLVADAAHFTDGSPVVLNADGMIQLPGENCCDECFSPSCDTNFGYGDVAIPESCSDEDCDCHVIQLELGKLDSDGTLTDLLAERNAVAVAVGGRL